MRKAVPALSAGIALAAFLIACRFLPPLAPAVPPILAWAFLAGGMVGWLLLRHAALALIVALAPLMGIAWALAMHLPAGLGAYGFGCAAGFFVADAGLRSLLEGGGRNEALATARDVLIPLTLSVILLFTELLASWRLGVAPALCAVAAILLLPAALAFLPLSESFFTRANRAREIRNRLITTLADIAEPRWSIAVTGVALVLVVLAGFKWPPSSAMPWVGTFMVYIILQLRTRNVSVALGGALAVLLFELYAPGSVTAFAGFCLFVLILSEHFQGDSNAWRQALEARGGAIIFSALVMALILAPVSPRDAPCVLVALVAAIVFFPALSILLARTLPRRRGVEESYLS